MKMPPSTIDPVMLAPCGMNCMVCYQHCRCQKACEGCHSSGGLKPRHCRRCQIKDCLAEKPYDYCYQCGDYPCKQIKNLEKSYTSRYGVSLMENSRIVKEEGLAAFIAAQKLTYTCPACGGIVSLHDGECTECRFPVKKG